MEKSEKSNLHSPVRAIVLTGLMAALVVVGSMLRISVPAALGTTSFHLGNIMCALSGILLGPAGGGLAAGLGSAIYDMTNPRYISECWITFLTKGAYGLLTGAIAWSGGRRGTGYARALAGTAAGAALYAGLYFLKKLAWDGMFLGGLPLQGAVLALADKIPATLFNAVAAILIAPPLAMAVQRARRAAGLLR